MLTINDIQQLRQTLEARGCFKHARLRSMLKIVSMTLIAIVGYVIALKATLFIGLLLLLPLSIPFAVAVMMGHEAGHQAIFRSRFANRSLFLILFSLIGGVSVTYWSHKHNKRHHTAPNVMGMDDDIELWPIAFYREKIAASCGTTQFFQKHCQHWLFWGICFFLSFSMRWDSIVYFFKHRHQLKHNAVLDIILLTIHYLLWLLLPLFFFGIIKTLLCYLVLWAFVGWILAMVFIVGHTGRPVLKHLNNRWLVTLTTSQNTRLPRWLSWCFVGLDYQIEHHLFPKLSHFRIKKASAYVKAWAKERQLPYHEEASLFQALKSVYLTLKRPCSVQ
ncbi:MAG: acyl-CoA desaturase [Gammaproteobacteria bacterium]|nr:acyl-CoA desaturase [Gammaproteobacteria bacterium]